MNLNIVFTGIGGQGLIVASDIFCEAAILDGFDVTKSEVHGMSQRGGSVIVHVSVGDNIVSPVIEKGTGDIILGFEILESVRILHLLKDKGTVVINKQFIPPVPVIQGLAECPDIDELMDRIRHKTQQVYVIDGINHAHQHRCFPTLTCSAHSHTQFSFSDQNPKSKK